MVRRHHSPLAASAFPYSGLACCRRMSSLSRLHAATYRYGRCLNLSPCSGHLTLAAASSSSSVMKNGFSGKQCSLERLGQFRRFPVAETEPPPSTLASLLENHSGLEPLHPRFDFSSVIQPFAPPRLSGAVAPNAFSNHAGSVPFFAYDSISSRVIRSKSSFRLTRSLRSTHWPAALILL